jgi:hypothetical protein
MSGAMLEADDAIELSLNLLQAARAEMAMRLAASITITRDLTLQRRLREFAQAHPEQEFLISQNGGQSWLKIATLGSTINRTRPPGLPALDLDELLVEPEFEQTLWDSMQRTRAANDANTVLAPLFDPSPVQLRSDFADIFEWAPLLERLAYSAAIRVLHVLEALRPAVRFELRDGSRARNTCLEAYWQLMHVFGQLTMIASSSEARPWLANMASNFVWQEWTPSLALVRERTFWLAAIAARSAAAFGEAAVEGYLRNLSRAKHPTMVFDVLFGLTAIALANPSSKASILTELSGRRSANLATAQSHSVHLIAYESAVRVLRDSPAERRAFPELHWRAGSAKGMATPPALIGDPTTLSASGEYLGFMMLPYVIESPHDELFPTSSAYSEREISRRKIAIAFRRAWITDPQPPRNLLH